MSISLADSFMAIFGFKRVAKQKGNIIELTQFPFHACDEQCDICGDHDCDGGLPCSTGDGV